MPQPSSIEGQLLRAIPPEYAGRLAVILISFASFVLLWLLFAKRPTSSRSKAEAVAEHVSVKTAKTELATRIVSTVHAVVVAQGAIRAVLYDESLRHDMGGTSDALSVYTAVALAYFLGDMLICCVQFDTYGYSFLFHAVGGFVCFSWACMGHQAHFSAAIGLIWEVRRMLHGNRLLCSFRVRRVPVDADFHCFFKQLRITAQVLRG